MNRTTKAAVVVFVLLCAGWYCDKTVVEVIPSLAKPADFNAYYEAARNITAGHSPFSYQPYIYPPFLAMVLTPVASRSFFYVRWIWFVVSQACLLLAAWLTWRAIGRDWMAACIVAFVWALGGAAPESLGLGQPGPELTLLVAIAITQRGWRAAMAVATGAAIKLVPGVLAVGFLLRRQWRNFLICAGTAGVLVLAPWSVVLCCLDGPRSPGSRDTWSGTPAPLSWGIPSVVLRAMDPPKQGGPLPEDWSTDIPYLRLPDSHRWIAMASSAITLLVGFAVLAIVLRRSSRFNPLTPGPLTDMMTPEPLVTAALVSLSLAASPVCWTHYQMLQYPGVALLLSLAARSRRWVLVATALVLGSLLYPLPVSVLTDYYTTYGKWTVSLPTFYFWTSITPVASLALFGLFAREAGRNKYG